MSGPGNVFASESEPGTDFVSAGKARGGSVKFVGYLPVSVIVFLFFMVLFSFSFPFSLLFPFSF